ncbi:hypothetical protein AB0J38_23435 [Streptomyces sp. NPDC050095]|uniref:hypothetical protein n=1 Tax=unclassified Streptomyces TaxID=2593676 RepID=UPI003439B518
MFEITIKDTSAKFQGSGSTRVLRFTDEEVKDMDRVATLLARRIRSLHRNRAEEPEIEAMVAAILAKRFNW